MESTRNLVLFIAQSLDGYRLATLPERMNRSTGC